MAERVRVAIRNENEKPEILHESQPPHEERIFSEYARVKRSTVKIPIIVESHSETRLRKKSNEITASLNKRRRFFMFD